ncbi:MAG: hypothetical protein ACRC46_07235 [Thermoguttaceae bacterium]
MSLSLFDPFARAVDASLLATATNDAETRRTSRSLGTLLETHVATTPEPFLTPHETDPRLRGRLRLAVLKGRAALRETQQQNGAWTVTQNVPTPLLVETLLALAAIGEDGGTCARRCAALLKSRLDSGTGDVDSVLLYLTLKIYRVYFPQLANVLASLRTQITAAGGIKSCSATTRLWLAIFGQIPYRLRDVVSLTPSQRRIVAAGVVCTIPICRGVSELIGRPPRTTRLSHAVRRAAAKLLSLRSPETSTHDPQTTLMNIVAEMSQHDASGLHCLQQLAQIESLFVTDATGELVLWNGDAQLVATALAANVLSADGARTNEVQRAVAWQRNSESSGSIESLVARIELEQCVFAASQNTASQNATPEVRLVALANTASLAGAKRQLLTLTDTADSLQDDIRELVKLQSPNGLWNSVSETGRVLAVAGKLGLPDPLRVNLQASPSTRPRPRWAATVLVREIQTVLSTKSSVARAVAAIKRLQQRDGCWCDCWHDNNRDSLVVTASVVAGLAAVVTANDESLARGVNWLLSQEWYKNSDAGRVAVVLQSLIAAAHGDETSVVRGVEQLLDTQNDDGVWSGGDHSATCHAVSALAAFAADARERLRPAPFSGDNATIPIRAIRIYLEER